MKNSSEPDPNTIRDRALATLALGVTENQTSSVASISDDELVLFYRNQLNDEQRSRVMHAIANDDSTYQRWIDLVQANELADELVKEVSGTTQDLSIQQPNIDSNKTIENSIETKSWSLLDCLRSWIPNDRGWTAAFGMGGVVALVAGLTVLLVPQLTQNPTLDELYDQYALSGSALLPEKSIDLSSSEENTTYSTAQTEMAKGITEGFKILGATHLPAEWEPDANRFTNTDPDPDRGDDSPYALGKLVALSLIQCKLGDDDKYFKSAAPLMEKLVYHNDSLAIQTINTGTERSDVCDTSEAIIKMM